MEEIQINSIKDEDIESSGDVKGMKEKLNEVDSSDTNGRSARSTDSYASILSSGRNTVNDDVHVNNRNGDENANVNDNAIRKLQPADLNLTNGESSDDDDYEDGESQNADSENDSCISTRDDDSTGCEEDDLEDGVPCANVTALPLQRQSNPVLPDTVTVLETVEGCKVYLVGTAHFSLESQEDVAKTIQATQPDILVLELCSSRVNILALDEETILEEAKNLNFQKMRAAIQQGGVVEGCLHLLLLSMSAYITKQLGMAPGGEFRRAFTEARKVPGCMMQFGDRPIRITLKRALAALTCWQKMRLAWNIITNKEPISKEEVERCKQRDLLEELLAEMTGEFPALSTVFVKERDIFLAYALRLAATPIQAPNSSDGIIPQVVVGVVGMGHVSGIVEQWNKVTDSDIPPILSIPEESTTSKVLKKTFRYSVLGLALWGCYRFLAPKVGLNAESARRSIDWFSNILHR